ncbi:hypothetical protein [Microcoleus sp. B3-D7]|uniref:hypothetical protein n=1 Tax=Microcoleus sp. B3-D7 TaxID=2818659 RepID=UPI002FCFAC60
MKPDELPDMNVTGLVTLSDFYAHQHEVIETALKNAEIPHQIELYPPNAEKTWRDGAFRVYVPSEYVKSGRELCIAIEFSSVF